MNVRSPRALGTVFGAYLGFMFFAAWWHSKDLAAPWYGPDLSRWIYGVYLVAAACLLSVLTGITIVVRVLFSPPKSTEKESESDADTSAIPTIPPDEPRLYPSQDLASRDHADQDIDQLIGRLDEIQNGGGETTMIVRSEPVFVRKVVTIRNGAEAAGSSEHALAEALERARTIGRLALSSLRGPMAAAIAFLGLSGAMLPGADAMLQTYHQLNTTLILGMAYGWIGLGAYIAMALRRILRHDEGSRESTSHGSPRAR